jgi:hypothetical protein
MLHGGVCIPVFYFQTFFLAETILICLSSISHVSVTSIFLSNIGLLEQEMQVSKKVHCQKLISDYTITLKFISVFFSILVKPRFTFEMLNRPGGWFREVNKLMPKAKPLTLYNHFLVR